MTETKQHGRRRADARAKTPLTELTAALNANSGVVGRRAAVVAAAGGLVVAAGMPSALAAGHDDAKTTSAQSTQKVAYEAQAAQKVDAPAKAGGGIEAVSVSVKATKAPKPAPAAASKSTSSDSSSSGSSSSSDSGSKSSGDAKLPDGSKAEQVIALAKQYVGVPYVSGGTSPSGWDCSGFTSYVYGKVGVNLPRTSGAQQGAGKVVSKSEAKPGDIIWHPGHVGIYAGNGMMYDAGNPRVNTSYRSASWMLSSGAEFIRVL